MLNFLSRGDEAEVDESSHGDAGDGKVSKLRNQLEREEEKVQPNGMPDVYSIYTGQTISRVLKNTCNGLQR